MRGRELRAAGILRNVWRLPGQKANVGIWSARDADQLTEALQSLPIWPLITLEVTPLATHPLFADQSTFRPGSPQTHRSPPA